MKNKKSVKTKNMTDKTREERKGKKVAKKIEDKINVVEELSKESNKKSEGPAEESYRAKEEINEFRMQLQKRQKESRGEKKEMETWKKIEKATWEDLRNETEEIFRKKCKKMGVDAILELELIDRSPPVDDFYVYGEAFPSEHRIWLEIDSPETSTKEITDAICHELLHIKSPELDHFSKEFKNKVREYIKD